MCTFTYNQCHTKLEDIWMEFGGVGSLHTTVDVSNKEQRDTLTPGFNHLKWCIILPYTGLADDWL